MEPDRTRLFLFSEERGDRFPNARPEVFPTISLREDRFGQALGNEPAVRLLSDFEDQSFTRAVVLPGAARSAAYRLVHSP
jgi:hypothetical protein